MEIATTVATAALTIDCSAAESVVKEDGMNNVLWGIVEPFYLEEKKQLLQETDKADQEKREVLKHNTAKRLKAPKKTCRV